MVQKFLLSSVYSVLVSLLHYLLQNTTIGVLLLLERIFLSVETDHCGEGGTRDSYFPAVPLEIFPPAPRGSGSCLQTKPPQKVKKSSYSSNFEIVEVTNFFKSRYLENVVCLP